MFWITMLFNTASDGDWPRVQETYSFVFLRLMSSCYVSDTCVTAIQSSVITWVATGFHSLDKSQLLALQLQQLTTARENFDKEGWQEVIQQVSLFLPFSSAAANVGPLASAEMSTKAQV